MQKYLLLNKIHKAGYKSERDFAEELPFTYVAFNNKLNGKTQFKVNEIKMISKLLHIDDYAEQAEIFLA